MKLSEIALNIVLGTLGRTLGNFLNLSIWLGQFLLVLACVLIAMAIACYVCQPWGETLWLYIILVPLITYGIVQIMQNIVTEISEAL